MISLGTFFWQNFFYRSASKQKCVSRILYQLRTFGTKLGLDTIRALLDELGSPDDDCRFIHIAGTNGKGSFPRHIEQKEPASWANAYDNTSAYL